MPHGQVKWFNSAKGFGFIAIDGVAEDAFVHHTAIREHSFVVFSEGTRVEFEVERTAKGLQARDVRPLGSGASAGGSSVSQTLITPAARSHIDTHAVAVVADPLTRDTFLRALARSFQDGRLLRSGASINDVRGIISREQEVTSAVEGLVEFVDSPRAAAFGLRLRSVWRDRFAADSRQLAIGFISEAITLIVEDVCGATGRVAQPPVVRSVAAILLRFAVDGALSRPVSPSNRLVDTEATKIGLAPGFLPPFATLFVGQAPVPSQVVPSQVVPSLGVTTGAQAQWPVDSPEGVRAPVRNDSAKTLRGQVADALSRQAGDFLSEVEIMSQEILESIRNCVAMPLDANRSALVAEALIAFRSHAQALVSPVLPPKHLEDALVAVEQLSELDFGGHGAAIQPLFMEVLLGDRTPELVACARLICQLESIPLPQWAWTALGSTTSLREERVLESFTDSRTRAAVEDVSNWVKTLPEGDALLLTSAPAEEGGSALQMLQGALEAARKRASLGAGADTESVLQGSQSMHREWVFRALNSGEKTEQLKWAIERLENFKNSMPEASFRTAFEHVTAAKNPEERDSMLKLVRRVWDEGVRNFGPTGLSPVQLSYALNSSQGRVSADVMESIQIEAWAELFGSPAKRPCLWFRSDPDPRNLWGTVSLPLVLRASRRVEIRLRIRLHETSGLQNAWPSTWPPIDDEVVVVSIDSWQRLDASEEVEYLYTPTILIRRPISGRFVVNVSIADDVTRKPIGKARDVGWDMLTVDKPTLSCRWEGTNNPDFVSRHPVGPQTRFEAIRERVEQVSSFAVFAPRRFGKTTLTKRIEQLGGEIAGLCVLETVPCTTFSRDGRFDYERFWQAVGDNLQALLHVGMQRQLEDDLPVRGAFDQARKNAFAQGKNLILLLVDEAQLFFPAGRRGHDLGNRLKDSIVHWTAHRPGMARLMIGLVGLPNLNDRAGLNLMTDLRPVEHAKLDESEVNRLLLEVTAGGLETNVAARLLIIDVSVNLMVLREIVERLVARARAEARNWLVASDVQAVSAAVLSDVRRNPDSPFGQVVRDIFNDGDSVNEFVPNPCFAVALALSAAGFGGRRRSIADAKSDAVRRLSEWCSRLSVRGEFEVAAFDPARFDQEVVTLRDRGVISASRFSSTLLDAWLDGRLNRLEDDEGVQSALLGVSVRAIRRPGVEMEEVAVGSQARIFRFRRGVDELAWREFRLPDEQARLRVATSAGLMGGLVREQRRAGCRYVFDLEEIGFVEREPDIAVQVYRWIPGRDLSEHVKGLSPAAVVEVGLKLIEGVSWLHSHDVLHRDVRPKNVVLREETLDPVLIDFGLAKRAAATGDTRLEGEHVAPEVMKVNPEWTRSADVFALCSTLRSILRPTESSSGAVVSVLDGGLADIEARVGLLELKQGFQRLARDLSVDAAKAAAWGTVERAISADRGSAAYCGLVSKFRFQIEAQAIGLRSDDLHRCALAADFLNQVLESSGTGSSLGAAKQGVVDGVEGPEIGWLHALRIWKSHGSRELSVVVRRVPISELKAATLRIAATIGAARKLSSVQSVTIQILGMRPQT